MSLGISTILVVPCYNEKQRLDGSAFLDWVGNHDDLSILFVNDGSTDDTAGVIDALAEKSDRIHTLNLDPNGGKAEAVRRGMLWCGERDYQVSGYWDADLSTPLAELPALLDSLIRHNHIDVVTGARIKLVGRQIIRNPFRHYSGRAFATAVSILFGIEMYDTQCGAKLFRNTPDVVEAFKTPFHTKWVFDVELLVRLSLAGRPIPDRLAEVPLQEWKDVAGTKMKPTDFTKAPLELLRIHLAYFGPS